MTPAYLHFRSPQHKAAVSTAASRAPAPLPEARQWFWNVVLVIFMIAILIAAGCKSGRTNESLHLSGELIGQVVVLVETSIPDAGPVGKKNLPVALEKAHAAGDANKKANEEYAALDGKFTKLDGKWYVKAGRWIERLCWIIAGSWLLSGVFATLTCGGLVGGTKLLALGKFFMGIHHAMPLPNPFDPLADRIREARAPAQTGVTS
jgi:hypothetical protein